MNLVLWRILSKYGFIRTAEEEEKRRFLAAEVVVVPQTDFGKSVHRLLRACMNTCPPVQNMDFEFVNAGDLQLYSYYHEPQSLLKLHDRWLEIDSAVVDLGLPTNLEAPDVVFHAVKRLFCEALNRLKSNAFNDSSRSLSWHRQREGMLADQRILRYMRINWAVDFHRSMADSSTLVVHWGACDEPVNLQLHDHSRCSSLRQCLTSKEGKWSTDCYQSDNQTNDSCHKSVRPQDQTCLHAEITSNSTPLHEQRPAADDSSNVPKASCKSITVPPGTKTHRFSGLDGGKDYFLILALPDDPDSILFVSSQAVMVPPSSTTSVQKNKPSGTENRETTTQTNSETLNGRPSSSQMTMHGGDEARSPSGTSYADSSDVDYWDAYYSGAETSGNHPTTRPGTSPQAGRDKQTKSSYSEYPSV